MGLIVQPGWRAERCDIKAGQELTHLTLKPGEHVRSPLVALVFWQGENLRGRRTCGGGGCSPTTFRARRTARFLPPILFGNTSGEFNEMCNANEENQKHFIDRYVQERVRINYWWMDAGWYPCDGNWPKTGTWEPDLKRFPRRPSRHQRPCTNRGREDARLVRARACRQGHMARRQSSRLAAGQHAPEPGATRIPGPG